MEMACKDWRGFHADVRVVQNSLSRFAACGDSLISRRCLQRLPLAFTSASSMERSVTPHSFDTSGGQHFQSFCHVHDMCGCAASITKIKTAR